jgi:hypothetical protein
MNLRSNGRWITVYIDLSTGYDVNDIDLSTLLLDGVIPAERGEVQGTALMVKFDRSDVQDLYMPGNHVVTVTGNLLDGTFFEGSDAIRVIEPGK